MPGKERLCAKICRRCSNCFFPSGYNKLLACDKAVQCANSMITVIKKGINPILKQYDYPELGVKIGIDEGENVIVQYGHDKSSLIDVLGYSMSISAKITSLTNPDKITIGKDVYDILHPEIRSKFTEIKYNVGNWKYADRRTGRLYKLSSTTDSILAEGLDFILSHFEEPIWPSLLSILMCFILIVDILETDFLKKGYSSNCQSQYI